MFRLFQVDPDTASLHVNATALRRHARHRELWKLIEEFFVDGPHATLLRVANDQAADPGADEYLVYSNLLHELRHFVDLVFTPYGFHRLRTAFECYHTLPQLIASNALHQVPVPLMSGADPINQRLLGLTDYSGSLSERYSKLLQSRALTIAIDNSRHGGEAILEALAFSQQAEISITLFDDSTYEKRMPYLNRDMGNGRISAFDKKYRWHYAMLHMLCPNPDANVLRTVYWMLFASLCGSVARDAKWTAREMTAKGFEGIEVPGRFIDERLPSYRLRKLFDDFKEAADRGAVNWENGFAEVDAACARLFGLTIREEIAADIASDDRMVNQSMELNREVYARPDSIEHDPIWPFKELLARRKDFLAAFDADPECFVRPQLYLQMMQPERLPRVVYEFPHGLENDEFVEDGWKIVSDRHWRDGSGEIQKAVYSKHRSFGTSAFSKVDSAWLNIFSALSPAYKVLLYGRRYHTINEFSLASNPLLNHMGARMRWDNLYNTPSSVSGTDSIFDFFGIPEIECDECAAKVRKGEALYVSGWTVRNNQEFVRDLASKHPPYLFQILLGRDWSGWVLCNACIAKFRFR